MSASWRYDVDAFLPNTWRKGGAVVAKVQGEGWTWRAAGTGGWVAGYVEAVAAAEAVMGSGAS